MVTVLQRITPTIAIPLLMLAGSLLTSGPLDAQETNYVNQTGEIVHVYQQPGAGSPLQFLLSLQPNSAFRDVGPRISPLEFRLGSGQAVQQVNAGPGQVTLIRNAAPANPAPGGMATEYVNETGEMVHVYQQQGTTYPQTAPTFVQSLHPGQAYRVSGAQISPISFRLASGFGQIQQQQRQSWPERIFALVKMGTQPGGGSVTPPAAPGAMDTVYINETGEVVHVYQQQGMTYPATGQTWVQSLQPGQEYRVSGPQVSPVSFRLASGYGQIQQVQRQTWPERIFGLVKMGQPGWQQGSQPGWQQGSQPGWQQGSQPGWQQGWQPGWQQGWRPGWQQGWRPGWQSDWVQPMPMPIVPDGPSDISLKDNITAIDNSLDLVSRLNGVHFTWKHDGKKSLGLIAQEVEKVLPEMVGEMAFADGRTIKGVKYSPMVGLLIEAIKDQQTQIDALKSEIAELKQQE